MADQNSVQVTKGSIVLEKEFDVSGSRKDGTKFALSGFKVRIVFEDVNDMRDAAARSVVIACQNKVRTAVRANEALPLRPGTLATVNSKGNVSLTPEEKANKAVQDIIARPELLDKASPEVIAQLQKVLSGLGKNGVVQVEHDGSGEDDTDQYKYDEDELNKLSVTRLRVLAQKEGLERYDDLDKLQLIDKLSLIESN